MESQHDRTIIGDFITMDYRLIINEVRAALEEKAQREAGTTPGDPLPLFVELENYVREILPAVQKMYDSLATVQRIWEANGVDQILAKMEGGNVPLDQGIITADEWKALQRLFAALQLWAVTPIVLPNDPEKPGPIPIVVISQRPKILTPAQMAARK